MLGERDSGEIAPSFDVTPKSEPSRRASGTNIIFINRYFYPDHSATSQILSDLAFHLADSARVVRVLAIQQSF
jgi:hypothetical protein